MRFRAVCFDLLTALVDSWSLWAEVAGAPDLGRRWRLASLRLVTGSGAYRPYEDVVREAADEVGLPRSAAQALMERWGELAPYPDVEPALVRLQRAGVALVIVTNTSQRLAEVAARRAWPRWRAVISAEAAGWYKPAPQAYRAGWEASGQSPDAVLFCAGSAHDVAGAGAAGLATYWVNRERLPAGEPPPLADEPTLERLPAVVDA
jgi:2-haloacid dehalogenase